MFLSALKYLYLKFLFPLFFFFSLPKPEDCPQTAASVAMEIMDSAVTKGPLDPQVLLAFQVRTPGGAVISVHTESELGANSKHGSVLGTHGKGKDKRIGRALGFFRPVQGKYYFTAGILCTALRIQKAAGREAPHHLWTEPLTRN